jgi:nucleoid DNA-binding protein/cell division protein FtsN
MNPQAHRIWPLIKSLLKEHDCVIVPGFGGFVGNPEPARIDQVSHLILPPGKRIVFNQNLKTNDGLLAGKFSETLNLSYADALRQIEELVQNLVEALHEKKQLTIESFGNFRLNAEANYVFLPDRQQHYTISSYGLLPLQAQPVSSRYIQLKRSTRLFREKKPNLETKEQAENNIWPKILVSTLVILLLVNGWVFYRDHNFGEMKLGKTQMSFMGWIDSVFKKQELNTDESLAVAGPIMTDTPAEPRPAEAVETVAAVDSTAAVEIVSPELIPASSPLETIHTPVKEAPETAVGTNAEPDQPAGFDGAAFGRNLAAARQQWYIPAQPSEPAPEPVPETVPAENNTPLTVVTPANNNKTLSPVEYATVDHQAFYIIGGVFCKTRNAQRFCADMNARGYKAELLKNEHINCNRVSLGKFLSRKDAEQFLATVKSSDNASAWLLAGE